MSISIHRNYAACWNVEAKRNNKAQGSLATLFWLFQSNLLHRKQKRKIASGPTWFQKDFYCSQHKKCCWNTAAKSWLCCSVVATKIRFSNKTECNFNVAIFCNTLSVTNRNMMIIFEESLYLFNESLHLLEKRLKSWQLETSGNKLFSLRWSHDRTQHDLFCVFSTL